VRRFGRVEALRGVELAVEPGELVAVLGASGSGKSTLLRTIAGLEPADAGRVVIDGRDQADVPPPERGVAMVFQSFALFPHLSVERNIGFGLRARREPDAPERVREAARIVRLEDVLDRRPGELSGGERQRVALARALAARPRVLLLDEPLSNLDAQLRASTRTEIRRLQEQTGVTTLHVTHDQDEALALGHRVAVLRDGRVEQVGTPDEIWERPASTWVARFVGTPPMNIVRAPLAGLELPAAPAHEAVGPGVDERVAPRGATLVGFRAEDALAAPGGGSDIVFELAERVGAERLWHLRAGGEAVVVRAPDGLPPPAPGAPVRVRATTVRRFDPGSGRALP
jgi:ABC-type sugar transport system ATPase subunit